MDRVLNRTIVADASMVLTDLEVHTRISIKTRRMSRDRTASPAFHNSNLFIEISTTKQLRNARTIPARFGVLTEIFELIVMSITESRPYWVRI